MPIPKLRITVARAQRTSSWPGLGYTPNLAAGEWGQPAPPNHMDRVVSLWDGGRAAPQRMGCWAGKMHVLQGWEGI